MWEYPQLADMEKYIALAIQLAGGVAPLAEVAGVSSRTVYAWKNGERFPSRNNLSKVSAYFESLLPAGEMLERDGTGSNLGEVSYTPGLPRPGECVGQTKEYTLPWPEARFANSTRLPLHSLSPHRRFDTAKGAVAPIPGCISGRYLAPSFLALPASPKYGNADNDGYAFDIAWLQARVQNPGLARLLRITGKGMETTLHDRDICLVDTLDTTLIDDRIYVLRYGDEIFVKRFSRMPGGHHFRGDNRELAHQDFVLKPSGLRNEWDVLGRIIWVGKEL